MPEPRVIVMLVSPLEALFDAGGEVPEQVKKSYQTLTAKGMKILFVTRTPLDEAAAVITPLDPPAPLLNPDEGLFVPEESHFPLPEVSGDSPNTLLSTLLNELRSAGEIVIPVGIGRLPGHAFLNEVELAALLPGSERPAGNVSVYQCRADGPEGWCEWAETMMRRIRIILNKSEMRQWNGT